MRNIAILIMFCICFNCAHALDKKGSKQHIITVYGQQVPATEAEMFNLIYDLKYKSYTDLSAQSYEDIGMDPSYFIDDIKKFTDCYATAFAKSLSINDFEIIMSNDMSKALRDSIINNIANKEVDKCRKKYEPYVDGGFDSILEEYTKRKCSHLDDRKDEEGLKMYMNCTIEVLKPILKKAGMIQ